MSVEQTDSQFHSFTDSGEMESRHGHTQTASVAESSTTTFYRDICRYLIFPRAAHIATPFSKHLTQFTLFGYYFVHIVLGNEGKT